jgi:predicted RNA binding protein YcfA (HicA-like mRNA interferase family)
MIKRRKLIRVLKGFGVEFARHAKGSHEVYKSDSHWTIIPVCEELPEGTMWAIVEQLKIDKDEFKRRL